ncbi:MAG: GDP-mannose 4,6-dehydratase [Sedimentisphaerales bacterium]|nr:GDP-mannose 4,6-dehydratase [Sedimentisphaerales bacterium]
MTPLPCQTVLVTGAAGFLGRHLLNTIANSPNAPDRIIALDSRLRPPTEIITPISCDLTDSNTTAEIIRETRPDGIIHLAGVAVADPLTCFNVNTRAAANLLDAASQLANPPRVIIIGTAAQYGITSGDNIIVDENFPLNPLTPYALSKTMQEQWALHYARTGRVPLCCVRIFNIIGPGQSPNLVPAAFLQQLADVLAGRAEEICVGNTTTKRDFTDVRDVTEALWKLLTTDNDTNEQVFNLASGKAVKIADLLDTCLTFADREIPVRHDPARLKAADVPVIIGNNEKLRNTIDWTATIDWQQSLRDMWQEIRPSE